MSILLDGQPLTGLRSRTAEALLIYLVCHDQPQQREFLADFFWDERGPEQAAANLRTVLTMLRRTLGDYLIITRQTVAFDRSQDYWLDAAAFDEHLRDLHLLGQSAAAESYLLEARMVDRLPKALDLYHGDFLKGFHLSESLGFEEWSLLQRERLRTLASQGLQQLVSHYLSSGEYEAGLPYAERLVLLDPYNEAAQRQSMWLLARSGRRNKALQQFQSLQRLLAEELGVAPSAATQAAHERIRALDLPPPHNLPPDPTPFVGRARELGEISRQLVQPACRLLTIVGPGGIGKTRLAIEAARRLVEHRPGQFLDGLFFLPLAHLPSADYLVTLLADLLDLTFEGAEPSQQQLLAHLQDRELLLVLDNFEHLITTSSLDLLAGILAQAPAVKLLITSRERLRLVEEHLFDLQGMAYPHSGTNGGSGAYSAIQLFLQQARRVQPTFSPSNEEMATIVQLCQLAQGMPLAIELAASGVKYVSCDELLNRLKAQLDLAFGSWRNRPERHQSLQAVFEHSWSLLLAEEKSVARRFAVFVGPFDSEAAQAITGATPGQLAALHDKSFLQRRETGQYDLHPLLSQFLIRKLDQFPAERDEARQRHLEYYNQLLAAQGRGNMERNYHALRETLERNIDNVIAATTWAAERQDFADRRLISLVERLNFYFHRQHRYETWKVVYQQLIQALQKSPGGSYEERMLAGHLSARIAYADIRLHAYQRAEERLETILPEALSLENGSLICACLRWLGLIALRKGDFANAFRQVEASIEAVTAYPHQYRFQSYELLGEIALVAGQLARAREAYEVRYAMAVELDSVDEVAPRYELALGQIRHRQGQLVEARERLQKALSLARAYGEEDKIAACLERLGYVSADLGDYDGAAERLAEAESMVAALRDSHLAALVARGRGWLAECLDHFEEARDWYERSLALFEKVGDQAELPFAHAYLGRASARGEATEAASYHLEQASRKFELWSQRGCTHLGGRALTHFGQGVLYAVQGDYQAAQTAFKKAQADAMTGEEHYFALQAIVERTLLLARAGEIDEALTLTSLAQHHPATTARDKARLARALS